MKKKKKSAVWYYQIIIIKTKTSSVCQTSFHGKEPLNVSEVLVWASTQWTSSRRSAVLQTCMWNNQGDISTLCLLCITC